MGKAFPWKRSGSGAAAGLCSAGCGQQSALLIQRRGGEGRGGHRPAALSGPGRSAPPASFRQHLVLHTYSLKMTFIQQSQAELQILGS